MDEHIANSPKEVQAILKKIRTTIKRAAPDAEETINYGIPTFTLKGNLVHFAGFKSLTSGFIPRHRELRNSKRNCPFTRARRDR